MKKKIVFFDMDNVLVDYESALNAEKIKEQVPKYESVVISSLIQNPSRGL